MYEKTTYEMRHIIPISVIINSKSNLSAENLSQCERSCVCHCVCQHGGSKALDFENDQDQIMSKKLYKEFLLAQ